MIADISSPSHGVGIELGWASLREDYPVLCIRKKDSEFKMSGLVGGCPKFVCKEYSDLDEAVQIVD